MGVRGIHGQVLAGLAPASAAPNAPPDSSAVAQESPEAQGALQKPPPVAKAEDQLDLTASDGGPRIVQKSAKMSLDEESKQIVARIVDENDQVLKQIPPEETLRIAANFRRLNGLLFDQEA